jgi:hypothetical protein
MTLFCFICVLLCALILTSCCLYLCILEILGPRNSRTLREHVKKKFGAAKGATFSVVLFSSVDVGTLMLGPLWTKERNEDITVTQ